MDRREVDTVHRGEATDHPGGVSGAKDPLLLAGEEEADQGEE